MAEIPKVVRQRMVASAMPESHPDPDLLTAFAEQSLSGRERDLLLAHLARCAECREVVVLSTPPSEAVPQPSPARTRWLGWPALRWGALAACAAVVVAAVSLRTGFEARVPATRQETLQVARSPEPSSPPQAQVAASREKDRVAMGDETRIVPPKSPPVVVAPRDLAMARISPPPTTDKSAPPLPGMQLANKATALAAAPPARDKQPLEVTAGPVQTEAYETMSGKAKEAQANMDLSLESKRAAKSEVAPVVVGAFPAPKLTPRWTLSADGTLERSLDAGKTWKAIPVAPDATLTAVAAMDSDIWVGGSHGALYHSTDAGDHWTQVTPKAGGQPLAANIIGIEFSDVLHGKVTTANQEIWTTSDAGQTWQTSR